MLRVTWWVLLSLGLTAAGCATGGHHDATAPAPSLEDAREFYPLESGWKWAYDVEKGDDHILAVYAVVQRDGETAVMQAGDERLVYAVLPDGIARREASKEAAIGDFILKSPVRAGTSWPLAEGNGTVAATGRTVTVPGGTFSNCAIVEENRRNPARLVRTTYAPGVGPISIEYLVLEPSGRFEPALKASLRGVTRPGQDPLQ